MGRTLTVGHLRKPFFVFTGKIFPKALDPLNMKLFFTQQHRYFEPSFFYLLWVDGQSRPDIHLPASKHFVLPADDRVKINPLTGNQATWCITGMA
jgi:hypothetical protein